MRLTNVGFGVIRALGATAQMERTMDRVGLDRGDDLAGGLLDVLDRRANLRADDNSVRSDSHHIGRCSRGAARLSPREPALCESCPGNTCLRVRQITVGQRLESDMHGRAGPPTRKNDAVQQGRACDAVRSALDQRGERVLTDLDIIDGVERDDGSGDRGRCDARGAGWFEGGAGGAYLAVESLSDEDPLRPDRPQRCL